MTTPGWIVSGNIAELDWQSTLWQFDLSKPTAGLRVTEAPSSDLGHWLRVHPHESLDSSEQTAHSCQVDDWFARGSDLMVRYGQSAADRFAFQFDFRAVPDAELASFDSGLDVWLSVQTQLLDAHPALDIDCQCPGGMWTRHAWDGAAKSEPSNPGSHSELAMIVCTLPAGCGAFFIHPSDSVQTQWLTAEQPESTAADSMCVRMFGGFMEKGVIRRGRVRCLLGQNALPSIAVQTAFAHFARSPLPLTT